MMMWRRLGACWLLFAAMFLLCGRARAQEGRILFYTGDSTYSVSPAGSGLRLVTRGMDPDVSRDGRRLVVVGTDGLAVAGADGAGRRVIVPHISTLLDVRYPRFSPDGSRIVFTARANANESSRQAFVVASDGSGLRRLTQEPLGVRHLTFTPDGTRVLFEANANSGGADLVLIGAAGGGRTLFKRGAFMPSYSFDGARLAYVAPGDQDPSINELWICNANGTGAAPVRVSGVGAAGYKLRPRFSPNGRVLVFHKDSDARPTVINHDIYTVGVDGLGLTKLTSDTRYDLAPTWAPAPGSQVPTPTPTLSRPANDPFASAQLLEGPSGSVLGTNLNATKETGEASHAGNSGGASVWYTWTAPSSGLLRLSTAGSACDTLLAVYTRSSLSALAPVMGGSNDDSAGSTSSVSVEVAAGTTYFVAIDGYRGADGLSQGRLSLAWEFLASGTPTPTPVLTPTPTPRPAPAGPPANDSFFRRARLSPTGSFVEGFNNGATREVDEPEHELRRDISVWFEWQATSQSTTGRLSTVGSEFDTILSVYKGPSLKALQRVASNDDTVGNSSSVTFEMQAGELYYIALAARDDARGYYRLSYGQGAPTQPTISWVRPKSGNWNDAANWIDASGAQRVPREHDIVEIAQPGTYQVTVDANVNIGGISRLGHPTGRQSLLVSTHILTVRGASTVSSGAEVVLSGSVFSHHGVLSLQPGSTFLWQGGTVKGLPGGTSKLLVTPGATLQIIGTAPKYLMSQRLENRGQVLWTGASVNGGQGSAISNYGRWRFQVSPDALASQAPQLLPYGASPNVVFENVGGGEIENESDSSAEPAGALSIGKRAIGGLPAVVFAAVNNYGRMRSDTSGGFELRGGGASRGNVTVNNAARVLYGSQTTFDTLTSTIGGTGSTFIHGRLLMQTAGAQLLTSKSELGSNGLIDGPREVVVGSGATLTWRGGAMSGLPGQRTSVSPGAALDVVSGTLLGRTVSVQGSLRWRAGLRAGSGAVIEALQELGTQAGSSLSFAGGAPATLKLGGAVLLGDLSPSGLASFPVAGHVQFGPASRWTVDVRGTATGQFDQIVLPQAGTTATLGGSLVLRLAPGVRFPANTRLVVVRAPRIVGRFTFTPPPGWRLDASVPGQVALVFAGSQAGG
jgi:hypothetical protein